MSFTIVMERCIACGACEMGCPTGAVHQPTPQITPPAFWIATNRCSDCGVCASMCPIDCILPDPDTIVCEGRGCPVAPATKGPVTGWDCAKLTLFCDRCGDVLRRPSPERQWTCIECDLQLRARCPKARLLRAGKTGQQPPRRSVDALYRLRAGVEPASAVASGA